MASRCVLPCAQEVVALIEECISPDPQQRPSGASWRLQADLQRTRRLHFIVWLELCRTPQFPCCKGLQILGLEDGLHVELSGTCADIM